MSIKITTNKPSFVNHPDKGLGRRSYPDRYTKLYQSVVKSHSTGITLKGRVIKAPSIEEVITHIKSLRYSSKNLPLNFPIEEVCDHLGLNKNQRKQVYPKLVFNDQILSHTNREKLIKKSESINVALYREKQKAEDKERSVLEFVELLGFKPKYLPFNFPRNKIFDDKFKLTRQEKATLFAKLDFTFTMLSEPLLNEIIKNISEEKSLQERESFKTYIFEQVYQDQFEDWEIIQPQKNERKYF